jgi:hypothetical protein
MEYQTATKPCKFAVAVLGNDDSITWRLREMVSQKFSPSKPAEGNNKLFNKIFHVSTSLVVPTQS